MNKSIQEIVSCLPIKERRVNFVKPFLLYSSGEMGKKFFDIIEMYKSIDLLKTKEYVSKLISSDTEKAGVYNVKYLIENYDEIKENYHIVIAASPTKYRDIELVMEKIGYIKNQDFFRYDKILRQCKVDEEFFSFFVNSALGKEWLNSLQAPLYIDSAEGRFLKRLMISRSGKVLRQEISKFRPQCTQRMVVFSDGRVSMCTRDFSGDLILGDLNYDSFDDILRKRGEFLVDLYKYPLCVDCIGQNSHCSSVSLVGDEKCDVLAKALESLQLEVFSGCNYKCILCVTNEIHHHRLTGAMNLGHIFLKIEKFLPKIKTMLLFNQGEPLLNADLGWFVKKCRLVAPDLFMVVSTNAMFLNTEFAESFVEAKVDQIFISVHGAPGTEGLLRYAVQNANYEQVLNNVAQLIKIRGMSKYPKIRIKTALFTWNDSDAHLNKFRKDMSYLGLRPIGNSEEGYYWILDSFGYDRSLSSKKYIEGSEYLEQLKRAGEYQKN